MQAQKQALADRKKAQEGANTLPLTSMKSTKDTALPQQGALSPTGLQVQLQQCTFNGLNPTSIPENFTKGS